MKTIVVRLIIYIFVVFNIYGRQLTVNARQKLIIPDLIDQQAPRKGCSIDINNKELPEPQPLLLIPNTNKFFTPKTKNGTIQLKHGEPIEIYCTKEFSTPFKKIKSLIAYCNTDAEFSVNGKFHEFKTLNCSQQTQHTARLTNRTCYDSSKFIEVGFNVAGRFAHLMDICHNLQDERTYYSHHVQTPSNNGFQRSFPRMGFHQGTFYGKKNVNDLYTKKTQQETIGRILGALRISAVFDENESGGKYLARGHLTAKADYIFGSQQRATFYYLNTAPQWQSFNAGNWESVEHSVRSLVSKRNITVDIYTGTFGTLKLMDANGDYQEIFLYFDPNNERLIPVPMLFYKLIIDQKSKKGIVLIGVNNPHVTLDEIAEEYVICEDVSESVKWINWKNKVNIAKGYLYACDVNEFSNVIGHLPSSIKSKGLLI